MKTMFALLVSPTFFFVFLVLTPVDAAAAKCFSYALWKQEMGFTSS